MIERWSLELPKDPALYLFFGEVKGYSPCRMTLCEVRATGEVSERIEYVVEGQFVEPSEMQGAWRPFDEEPPNLTQMYEDARPAPKVSTKVMTALIQARYVTMDQEGEEAVSKIICTLNEGISRMTPKHQEALKAFKAMDYDMQERIVCKAIGEPYPLEPDYDRPV